MFSFSKIMDRRQRLVVSFVWAGINLVVIFLLVFGFTVWIALREQAANPASSSFWVAMQGWPTFAFVFLCAGSVAFLAALTVGLGVYFKTRP